MQRSSSVPAGGAEGGAGSSEKSGLEDLLEVLDAQVAERARQLTSGLTGRPKKSEEERRREFEAETAVMRAGKLKAPFSSMVRNAGSEFHKGPGGAPAGWLVPLDPREWLHHDPQQPSPYKERHSHKPWLPVPGVCGGAEARSGAQGCLNPMGDPERVRILVPPRERRARGTGLFAVPVTTQVAKARARHDLQFKRFVSGRRLAEGHRDPPMAFDLRQLKEPWREPQTFPNHPGPGPPWQQYFGDGVEHGLEYPHSTIQREAKTLARRRVLSRSASVP